MPHRTILTYIDNALSQGKLIITEQGSISIVLIEDWVIIPSGLVGLQKQNKHIKPATIIHIHIMSIPRFTPTQIIYNNFWLIQKPMIVIIIGNIVAWAIDLKYDA